MFPNAHSGSSCCLNLRGPGFNFAALVLIAALRSCCRWSEKHRAQCLFTSLKKRWNRINREAKDHAHYSAIKWSDFQILSLEQIANLEKQAKERRTQTARIHNQTTKTESCETTVCMCARTYIQTADSQNTRTLHSTIKHRDLLWTMNENVEWDQVMLMLLSNPHWKTNFFWQI